MKAKIKERVRTFKIVFDTENIHVWIAYGIAWHGQNAKASLAAHNVLRLANYEKIEIFRMLVAQ